jgi:DNA-binding LacI/PurR family transcriptional regulator
VVLVDCLDSEGDNSIQFDHAFAAETACHYLISQGDGRLR